MNFENPKYLLLLLFIPVYLLLKHTKVGRGIWNSPSFPFPWLTLLESHKKDSMAYGVSLAKEILLLSLLAVMVVALARPRGGSAVVTNNNLGVDIVLILDLSGSMTFVDEPPADVRRSRGFLIDTGGDIENQSRLEVAKRVIKNYIDKQEFNRIGLVTFVSFALTKAPLSSDKELLKSLVDEITYLDDGATAIGSGILTGLNRIKDSKAKSKVMILLTDGVNNAGIIEPISAANVARELEVKIYTIGLGNTEGSWQQIDLGVFAYKAGGDFDPETLQEIANITGGKYFEASSENALQDVYSEIDKLEKSEIEVKRRVLYEEKFKPWLVVAMILWGLWLILNAVVIRIP